MFSLYTFRDLLNEETYITLINIFDQEENVDLTTVFQNLPNHMEYVLVTDKSKFNPGYLIICIQFICLFIYILYYSNTFTAIF